MYRLTGSATDCAHWKRLWCFLGATVIAGCEALLDDLYLSIETRSTTFDEWHISRQAHLVHVSAGVQVIQRIEDDLEVAEPVDAELRVLNVGKVCSDVDTGVEFLRRFLRDLCGDHR